MRDLQMLKIGYLGPEGTFSHEALLKYYKGTNYEAVSFPTIPDILISVEKELIDEAVVPIENSIEGSVNATMDMIALEVDLIIRGELIIPIREHLLVKKGSDISKIRHILSHPQPLGQCRRYLKENLPYAETRPVLSSAAAAEEVSRSSGELAAIGSFAAAKSYNLDIAATDIQDSDNNLTRFIIVGRSYADRTGMDKTSIVFSTEDKPGSLYSILGIFNLWGINLSRIESRPAKNKLGRYIFFVDLIGHSEDEDMRDALTMVKRKTSFFKFLGSYPIYREETFL